MKRLAVIGGLLLALIALDTRAASVSIDVPIDPARLSLSPTEKAAYCGTTAPTCPEVPVPPSPPGIPPPVGWNGVCPGYANTRVMTLDWVTPQRLYSQHYGGFGITDAVVVKFTTGLVSTGASLPNVSVAEWNSPPSTREAALSDRPCDWVGLKNSAASSNSIQFKFGLGPSGTGFGYYPVLELATTYYLNIRNAPGSTCSFLGACDIFVDLVKPGGL